ncbi:MAG: hypothetical protein LBT68_06810 [Spirochaetales bacterium]|jgi:hypothetical protein|nr:hypothetical protein [Spirochaetales bacterium]
MKKFIFADSCVFFSSFTALVLMVFLSGNFQGFTGHSLFLLLDILKFSSFLCFFAGFVYLAYLVTGVVKKFPLPPPVYFTLAAFCLVFGLTVLLVSQFIITLTLPKL